jgi:hypothetical protein
MDIGSITAIVVTGINIIGWAYTKVQAIDKLNGRVDHLEKTSDRHEKILGEDGLVNKISECKAQIANLDGTLKTFIDLTKKQKN